MDRHSLLLRQNDPQIFAAIDGEEHRQASGLEMIPSENHTWPEVLACLGSVLTDKYAEGYPGRRYYGGQQFTDAVETLARERAKALFRAQHANVQPLSGSPMNQAIYLSWLKPGETVLGMELSHGGHLTHGAPVSHMGRLFDFVRYRTRPDGGIDYDQVRDLARKHRPKLVLCGFSSYPRDLDYAAFKSIAEEIGARTMADVSHIGGLIAAGVKDNPLDAGFDAMTTTAHKTLRGPRAGLILCKQEHAASIDSSVFPGLQGGPHMNAVAGTAVALAKAATPEFKAYGAAILRNAKALAGALLEHGVALVTGGTDNHLLVIDTIASFGLDGRAAEQALDRIGITVNKQVIPDDPRPPLRPSGIRLGTPACTTRGMDAAAMARIAGWIVPALRAPQDETLLAKLAGEIKEFARLYPIPALSS
ncbi:MAG: serine hydroxymethyltransferase [Reyranellaceae bacterium]